MCNLNFIWFCDVYLCLLVEGLIKFLIFSWRISFGRIIGFGLMVWVVKVKIVDLLDY